MEDFKKALRAPVIIGPGRVGRSLAGALRRNGIEAECRGRQDGIAGLERRAVLLCVPDQAIVEVAEQITDAGGAPLLIGHTSGATPLAALAGAGSTTFSLHPLQTVPDGETELAGCPAAVAGSTPEAAAAAAGLARSAGMRAFEIAESDRALYHAAASIASNYLITIEQTAAELLGGITAADPRQLLRPLVTRSLENWVDRGADALTGPIARGDEATVEAHRQALGRQRPGLVPLYDTLAERTREIASGEASR